MARGTRVELRPDLDVVVAKRIGQPAANRMARAIRDDVEATGPIDTGLLRQLAAAEVDLGQGTKLLARMVSSRPSDDGSADVAAWVDQGTSRMQPRRYAAASARRAIARLGYGRFRPGAAWKGAAQ